jgi:hypothetical protein
MRKNRLTLLGVAGLLTLLMQCSAPGPSLSDYALYPATNAVRPELPSPFVAASGEVYVTAYTIEEEFAIIPVGLSDDRGFSPQLLVDTADFPTLARTGLHSEAELDQTTTITGRSVQEITALARPGALSQGGFLAADENILDVIRGDNAIVGRMKLTHPQLATPLFHVLNMIDTDLSLDRWNRAVHRWEHICYFLYNGQEVWVEAEDTKGGQQSIFADGITGGFHIYIRRDFSPAEEQYLADHYGYLTLEAQEVLRNCLSSFHMGEMQAQYIMRYGFYEGHTFWRTDPVAIAFIFGLRSLPELDRQLGGDLYRVLTTSFGA